MTADLRYLRTRDGVFQYERRVPLRIQRDAEKFAALFQSRPLYRRSLGSKGRAEAMLAYAAVDRDFEGRTALLVTKPANPATVIQVDRTTKPKRSLTDHDLATLAQRYRTLTVQPFERLHRKANVSSAAAAELDRVEYELGLDADAMRRTLNNREPNSDDLILHPATEARRVIASENFEAPEGSEELGAIIAAVRTGIEKGFAQITALSSGEALPSAPISKQSFSASTSLTLRDAVERYLEARKLPVKAALETKLALRQFEELIGNRAIASLSSDDFHSFVQHLAEQTTGGKTTGSIRRHLSKQTIGKRLRMLSAVIQYAKDRKWFEGENLARGIRLDTFINCSNKAVMPDKRRLQVSEMNAIFQHTWFTGCRSHKDTHSPGDTRLNGSEYWVPVVAAYTGCRAAELGGMRLADVRLDHAYPHFIVRDNEYRRTKSQRSRCIPALNALLALGFARYVERIAKSGSDRLFPDWTAKVRYGGGVSDYPAWSNAAIIRAFNRTVIPTVLGNSLSIEARREVTFHSFRGAFKALLANTHGLPRNIVDEVIGHAKDGMDAHYIGGVTIEETYPIVHRCDYRDLVIPRLPTP